MLWTVRGALVAMAALAVTAVAAWLASRDSREVDPDRLAALIDRADRLVVRKEPWDTSPVLFESADRRDLDALKAAVRVRRPEKYEHCMCDGTPAVYLYAAGQEVGRLTNHHAKRVRCSLWDSDAPLLDADPWLAWFDARNIPGPRREFEDAVERDRVWHEQERQWTAALPPEVHPHWPAGKKPTGPDLPQLRGAFARGLPETPARIRAIFAWYGSGASPWSGAPGYEQVAFKLLTDYQTADLLAAVEGQELTPAETEGVARMFAGWDFSVTRPDDLKLLSPELKARLLAHSLTSTDEDKRGRAKRAFETN